MRTLFFKIENIIMKYDSSYSIAKDILKQLGGDTSKHFDSNYSIALEILKVVQGGGGSTPEKKAFDGKVALGDYLYSIKYDSIDYDAAFNYFNTATGDNYGACSLIRMGNIIGRSFDYPISEQVEFVCETPNQNGFYAVKGVVTTSNLTTDNVNVFSDFYKYLPFQMMDGINEKGLFISVNQLPYARTLQVISDNGAGNGSTVINMQMLTRYLLDRCSSVDEAINVLINDLHITPIFDKNGEKLNFHYCIADNNRTVYVYFTSTIHIQEKPNDKFVMTNFGLAVTNIIDGQYTQESNLYDYSEGVARANALLNVEDATFILSTLVTECNFTKAYTTTDRLDEFVDKTNLIKWYETDKLMEVQERAAQKYIDETNNGTLRINKDLWQTMHISYYRLNDKNLQVIAQELTMWDEQYNVGN